MKTQLTKEQSKHLIDLGVNEDMATYFDNEYDWSINDYPRYFTLIDLLEILPKEIKGEEVNNEYKEALLSIDYMDKGWNCAYNGLVYKGGISYNKKLIDALYELTVWCLENSYLTFD